MKRFRQDTINAGTRRTGIRVEVKDMASPWIAWAAKSVPRFTRSALKSAGWWLTGEIKKGMRSGAPGGKAYKPKMKPMRRRMLESAWARGHWGGDVKSRYAWFGKLSQGIGYEMTGNLEVSIGPLTSSASTLLLMHEVGYSRKVTGRMRKGFMASGVGIGRNKKYIIGPARPTFTPIYEKYQSQIPQYIEEKIWGYLAGNKERSMPTGLSAYRVYKPWF